MLRWSAQADARQFRVWAQWRVPEGEAVQTYEVVVPKGEAALPPSPMRWRPLKLSIEIQAICGDALVSDVSALRQLQFDARSEAMCPSVDMLQIDDARLRVDWKGDSLDRMTLSFHSLEDDKALAVSQVVTGSTAVWPPAIRRPAVIRASRACGELQRSRETFLLVR